MIWQNWGYWKRIRIYRNTFIHMCVLVVLFFQGYIFFIVAFDFCWVIVDWKERRAAINGSLSAAAHRHRAIHAHRNVRGPARRLQHRTSAEPDQRRKPENWIEMRYLYRLHGMESHSPSSSFWNASYVNCIVPQTVENAHESCPLVVYFNSIQLNFFFVKILLIQFHYFLFFYLIWLIFMSFYDFDVEGIVSFNCFLIDYFIKSVDYWWFML